MGDQVGAKVSQSESADRTRIRAVEMLYAQQQSHAYKRRTDRPRPILVNNDYQLPDRAELQLYVGQVKNTVVLLAFMAFSAGLLYLGKLFYMGLLNSMIALF